MSLLSAIILLGIIIFVHELGHFLFAKLMGVRVLKFSLGFGPKLIGKQYGDTEYRISAIPLGGYVKMLGETPGDELSDAEKPFAYNYQDKTVIRIWGTGLKPALTRECMRLGVKIFDRVMATSLLSQKGKQGRSRNRTFNPTR